MFCSLSCSHSIRQRNCRGIVTFLSLHWISQILIQLDSFHHCVELCPQRSRLPSSEAWIQISQRGCQSETTNPVLLILETGSPAKSLSTKTVILSACFCLRNLSAASGFPTRYRAARFNGTKSKSRGSLILWAKCFTVSARSNLSWSKNGSLMHADLYRVASSLYKVSV